MKKFNLTLLAALISSPLAAENIDKTWEVGVFADYIKSSTNKEDKAIWQQIEAGKSVGIDLQKIITEYWDVRLELAKTRYETQDGNDHDYGTRAGIDAIYKLEDSNAYVFGGVKRFNNVRSYNAVNLGAGYNFDFNDRLSMYTEAAIYKDVDYGYVDQGFKLGLKYAFGEVKKSAPVVAAKPVIEKVKETVKKVIPLDSDNDGIINEKDQCNDTAANVKVDAKGCTLFAEETVSINLNVAFANNSSIVEPQMMHDIQRLAMFMKEYTNTNAVIEGHSSVTGSPSYNLMLSEKRANAVKNVLINKFNIDESRLSAKGFGQQQLLSQGNTPADHKLNRRVVAQIETVTQKVMTK